jgi:hypothetical protein
LNEVFNDHIFEIVSGSFLVSHSEEN